MEIAELLGKIGLTEKEASVYLAVLELGTATGYAIARKANIKRPTAYLILEGLERKRLIHQVPHSSKILFTAESPEVLLRDITKKAELTKQGLPYLLALFNAKKEKPQVQLFQGKEGVKQAYDKIAEARSIRMFGTSVNALKIYPEAFKDFTHYIVDKHLEVKDILTDPVSEAAYIKIFKNYPGYKIRFMKKGTEVNSDFALFGDTVLLFSYRPEIFAVMITSKDMAQMFEIIFDLAWEAATPLN